MNKPMSAYDLHQELMGDTLQLKAVQTQYCGQVRCSIYIRKASAKAGINQARRRTTSQSIQAVRMDKKRRVEQAESAEDTLDTMKYACGFQCKGPAEHYANWIRANGYAEMLPDAYAGLGLKKPDGNGNGNGNKKRKKKKSKRMQPVEISDIVDDGTSFLMPDRDPEDLFS